MNFKKLNYENIYFESWINNNSNNNNNNNKILKVELIIIIIINNNNDNKNNNMCFGFNKILKVLWVPSPS